MKSIVFTESAINDRIKNFFSTLKDKDSYKYLEKIDSLTGSNFLIEILDLLDYDKKTKGDFNLWEFFTKETSQAIKITKRAVREIHAQRFPGTTEEKLKELNIILDNSAFDVTPTNIIRHRYLNKLVSVDCRIHGESTIQNHIIQGFFECPDGHFTKTESQDEFNTMPVVCDAPNCKHRKLELNKEKSEIQSFRIFYVKDLEYSDHSDSLMVYVTGDFIDSVKMGETVRFTGYASLIQDKKGKLFTIFHALNVSKPDEVNLEITEDDKKIFQKIVQNSEHYEKLVRSIASNIYGAEILKESFLLSYGGSPKWSPQQRNWINVLAVGDPAVAKSKIAQWASDYLENVKFVSSKAGSAKGLFAGQKEQVDGQKVLEVGPMVSLSKRGLLCIDEFSRMPEVFDIFYSPMETGSFNSATVGGHEDLQCETPIYATGNPHKSNIWDDDKSVVDNIQVIEPAMLSRFDLIIICKDNTTSQDRQKIARCILNELVSNSLENSVYSPETLNKFFRYAKTFNPVLTTEVTDQIVSTFDDVMKKKQSTMKNDETNMRLVGTLARITLAISRLHLHSETTIEDFQRAHNLIKTMLAQRGLQASNANTYIERVGQMILKILESSISGLTDPEIYDKLFAMFPEKTDSLRNDMGEGGPLRRENKRWRIIMENVEKSYMVEIETKTPRRLRWRHD